MLHKLFFIVAIVLLIHLPTAQAAEYQVAFSSVPNINNMAVDTKQVISYQVTNNGIFPASLAFSGVSTPISISGGNCGGRLASKQSCTIELTIAPTNPGPISQELVLNANNGQEVLREPIKLTVTPDNKPPTPVNPPIQPVNPPIQPVNPPIQPVNPPIQPVNPPIQPVNPPLQPVNPPIQPVNPPLQPLHPPKPIAIVIPATPLQPPIMPVNPPIRPLHPPKPIPIVIPAIPLQPPLVPISALTMLSAATPYDMPVNSKQDLQYTIMNTSTAPVTINFSGFTSPLSRDSSVANNCGTSLPAGASCNLLLQAAPKNAMKVDQSLIISTNGQSSLTEKIHFNVYSLAVDGSQSIGMINAYPGQQYNAPLVLKNITASEEVSDIRVQIQTANNTALTISKNACGASVTPGNSCTIELSYKAPTAITTLSGSIATINISYSDDAGNQQINYPINIYNNPYGHFIAMPENTNGYVFPGDNYLQSLHVDQNGTIFVGTLSSGLSVSYTRGTGFRTYTTGQGLAGDAVKGAATAGNYWYIASETGLAISHDSGANFTIVDKSSLPNSLTAVAAAGQYVYVGGQSTSGDLAAMSNDNGQSFTALANSHGIPGTQVNAIKIVDNSVYFATDQGLAFGALGAEQYTTKSTKDGLADNAITDLFINGETIYAATESGLSVSTDGGKKFATLSATANQWISAVYVDGLAIYAGFLDGVYVSRDLGKSFQKFDQIKLGYLVTGLYANGSRIYITSPYDGLYISENGGTTFTNYQGYNPFVVNPMAGPSTVSINDALKSNNHIYVAGTQLFTTSNDGIIFTSVIGGTNKIPAGITPTNIAADRNIVYVTSTSTQSSTNNNSLYMSNDYAQTFKPVLQQNGEEISAATRVKLGAGKAYVATNGMGILIGNEEGTDFNLSHKGLGTGFVNDIDYDVIDNYNGVIFAATTGGLSYSTDQGRSYVNDTTSHGLSSNNVTRVVVDKLSGQFTTLYVADGNNIAIATYATPIGTYKINPVGATINDLAVCVQKAQKVYVATDNGLAVSDDGGNTYQFVESGMTKRKIQSVTIDHQTGEIFLGSTANHGLFYTLDGDCVE